MDSLGERVIRDEALIAGLRDAANQAERDAKRMRDEANEIERLLELARQQF